jgi:hypothetical protein
MLKQIDKDAKRPERNEISLRGEPQCVGAKCWQAALGMSELLSGRRSGI